MVANFLAFKEKQEVDEKTKHVQKHHKCLSNIHSTGKCFEVQ